MSKRWCKKDIKWLKQQIDTFYLQNSMYHSSKRILEAIECNKATIVLSNGRAFKNLIEERGIDNRETAKHAKLSGVWGSSTQNIIDRFTKSANSCEKEVMRMNALLERIVEEGLPQEIQEYIPEGLKHLKEKQDEV